MKRLFLALLQPLEGFSLDLFLVFFLFINALFAVECFFRNFVLRRVEAVRVESSITFIADDEFDIVVIVVLITELASHILQTLIPFLSSDIHRPESQIALAFLGSAQAFRQRGVEDVKLVVECQLHVFFDVPECEYSDTDLSEYVPLLRNTVWLAGVVDEPSEIPLFGWIDDLPL